MTSTPGTLSAWLCVGDCEAYPCASLVGSGSNLHHPRGRFLLVEMETLTRTCLRWDAPHGGIPSQTEVSFLNNSFEISVSGYILSLPSALCNHREMVSCPCDFFGLIGSVLAFECVTVGSFLTRYLQTTACERLLCDLQTHSILYSSLWPTWWYR